MLDVAVQLTGLFLAFVGVVFVHELGHYYTARSIVDIPAEEVRLVLTSVPMYVALRDGEEWYSPISFDAYLSAYETHDPEQEHFERFAVAGELFQTGTVVPVALGIAVAGFPETGRALVVVSLLTIAVYVGYDAGMSLYAGGPRGDYSALWQTKWYLPLVWLLGNFLVHAGVFYYA